MGGIAAVPREVSTVKTTRRKHTYGPVTPDTQADRDALAAYEQFAGQALAKQRRRRRDGTFRRRGLLARVLGR